jgi:hypothetical protein
MTIDMLAELVDRYPGDTEVRVAVPCGPGDPMDYELGTDHPQSAWLVVMATEPADQYSVTVEEE